MKTGRRAKVDDIDLYVYFFRVSSRLRSSFPLVYFFIVCCFLVWCPLLSSFSFFLYQPSRYSRRKISVRHLQQPAFELSAFFLLNRFFLVSFYFPPPLSYFFHFCKKRPASVGLDCDSVFVVVLLCESRFIRKRLACRNSISTNSSCHEVASPTLVLRLLHLLYCLILDLFFPPTFISFSSPSAPLF